MSIISAVQHITTAVTPVTIYTATHPCTISLDITNDTGTDASVRLLYTPDVANSSVGHVMESFTLLAGRAVLSRNGLPVKEGWSFVVIATGESINLSALVSGFTVEA